MRMAGQPFNVGNRIAGTGTCAERWPANIDGVGAMVDGLDAEIGIFGRCQKLEQRAAAVHSLLFEEGCVL